MAESSTAAPPNTPSSTVCRRWRETEPSNDFVHGPHVRDGHARREAQLVANRSPGRLHRRFACARPKSSASATPRARSAASGICACGTYMIGPAVARKTFAAHVADDADDLPLWLVGNLGDIGGTAADEHEIAKRVRAVGPVQTSERLVDDRDGRRDGGVVVVESRGRGARGIPNTSK